jgi:hypothetical protein
MSRPVEGGLAGTVGASLRKEEREKDLSKLSYYRESIPHCHA